MDGLGRRSLQGLKIRAGQNRNAPVLAGALGMNRKSLRRGAGISRHFRYRIAFPHTDEQNLGPRRILKHIVHMANAFDFKEARAPRIWTGRSTGAQKKTQLGHLFVRMVSQVFQKGRLFCECREHFAVSPHLSLSPASLIKTKGIEKSFVGCNIFPVPDLVKNARKSAKLERSRDFSIVFQLRSDIEHRRNATQLISRMSWRRLSDFKWQTFRQI